MEPLSTQWNSCRQITLSSIWGSFSLQEGASLWFTHTIASALDPVPFCWFPFARTFDTGTAAGAELDGGHSQLLESEELISDLHHPSFLYVVGPLDPCFLILIPEVSTTSKRVLAQSSFSTCLSNVPLLSSETLHISLWLFSPQQKLKDLLGSLFPSRGSLPHPRQVLKPYRKWWPITACLVQKVIFLFLEFLFIPFSYFLIYFKYVLFR